MKCKFCSHFHRDDDSDHGLCSRLGQTVQAEWPACSVACFTSTSALTAIDFTDYAIAHGAVQTRCGHPQTYYR